MTDQEEMDLCPCGTIPAGKEPSIRPFRGYAAENSVLPRGHFVYDPSEVSAHIWTKLLVPARDYNRPPRGVVMHYAVNARPTALSSIANCSTPRPLLRSARPSR